MVCLGLYAFSALTRCGAVHQSQCQPVLGRPVPQIYRFNITSEAGASCTIAHLAAYFKVGTERYIDIRGANVSGRCDSAANGTESHLALEFECGYIDLRIVRKDKHKPMKVADLTGQIASPNRFEFKNNPIKVGVKAKTADHAYRCDSEQTIALRKPSKGSESVSLVLSDVLVEAFRDESIPHLYQPRDICALDDSAASYVVVASGLLIVAAIGTGIAYWVVSRRYA